LRKEEKKGYGVHSLFSQRRAHGDREPVSGARTTGSLPAPPPRRGWRPLLAGALATAFLALAAAPADAQGAWLTVPSMPTARSALAGATAPCPTGAGGLTGTCVYAIGGNNGTYLSTAEAYSPATKTWATLPSMPTARRYLAGATAPCPTGAGGLTGTCVYAIGGRNSSGFLGTAEAYSPATKTWATLPPMPTARSALAGATAPCPTGAGGLTGTCVYAIGGYNGAFLSTVEAYSPATNTWATLPSVATARSDLAGATAPCPTGASGLRGTCVYAIGGFNGIFALNTVEAYSPATNVRSTLPSLPTARADLAGATARCPTGAGGLKGTCVYAIGGNNGGKRSTVEAYSPAAKVWATRPSMPAARDSLAGATAPCPGALHHTCVYAIGGSSGGAFGLLNTAETGFLNTVETFGVER
jgi:hypothetical protein